MDLLEQNQHKPLTVLLMTGALILYLLNASGMVLMDPDEARCALVARRMLESGDWVVPQAPLLNTPYFDKPPLYFWLAKIVPQPPVGSTRRAAPVDSQRAGSRSDG